MGSSKMSDSKDNIKLNRKLKSRSSRAGLYFPVGLIHRQLRKGKYAERIGAEAPIYLAAVMEHLTKRFLMLARYETIKDKEHVIVPKHLYRVIQTDKEFRMLLRRVTIAHVRRQIRQKECNREYLSAETFWTNKAECEDAEKKYHWFIQRNKDQQLESDIMTSKDWLSNDTFRTYQAESNDVEKYYNQYSDETKESNSYDDKAQIVNMISDTNLNIINTLENASYVSSHVKYLQGVVKENSILQTENNHLRKVTDDLYSLVSKLEHRVSSLEKKIAMQ